MINRNRLCPKCPQSRNASRHVRTFRMNLSGAVPHATPSPQPRRAPEHSEPRQTDDTNNQDSHHRARAHPIQQMSTSSHAPARYLSMVLDIGSYREQNNEHAPEKQNPSYLTPSLPFHSRSPVVRYAKQCPLGLHTLTDQPCPDEVPLVAIERFGDACQTQIPALLRSQFPQRASCRAAGPVG